MPASNNLNKRQFITVLGEKLKVMRNDPNTSPSDEDWFMSHKTADNYGIESVERGIRDVYAPSGETIETVENLKHAVRVIQEHRNKNNPTPQ